MGEMPKPTTADDMLEASVLMNEDRLEDEALRAGRGSSEGKRWPVKLRIGGKLVEVVDQSEEDKAKIATQSVKKRVEVYDEETEKYAKYKLENMSEVEAIDFIRELPPGDRQIYLKAEKARRDHGRDAIFAIFGQPEKEK